MDEPKRPRKINPAWIKQQRTKLEITSPTSPHYAAFKAEIEAAEAELSRWEAFAAWIKARHGAAVNVYAARDGGVYHEPGTVFYAKDKATGKVTILTFAAAWAEYAAVTAG